MRRFRGSEGDRRAEWTRRFRGPGGAEQFRTLGGQVDLRGC